MTYMREESLCQDGGVINLTNRTGIGGHVFWRLGWREGENEFPSMKVQGSYTGMRIYYKQNYNKNLKILIPIT